NVAL
ncbi:hypothetical protein CPC197_1627, partial [Chlamydia psittaci C1/97]